MLDPALGPVLTIRDKQLQAAALVMASSFPPPHTAPVKIVWRVTGSGPFAFTASGPVREPATVLFGPEAHSRSNFAIPGDEWGTGFQFDRAGCWQFQVHRGTGAVALIPPVG